MYTLRVRLVARIEIEKLKYVFYFLFGSSLGIVNRNMYSHFASKMSLYPFQKIAIIGIAIPIPNITCLFFIPMPMAKWALRVSMLEG